MDNNDLMGSPIVESFTIRGLHGYKDVSINFLGRATVVVAENGTGKTTLLNALNAFLTRRFHRLNSLNFHRIECKFRDDFFPITLDRDAIGANSSNTELLQSASQKAGVSAEELLDYVLGVYKPDNFDSVKHKEGVANTLYMNTPGEDARGMLDTLFATYSTSLTDHVKEVGSLIQERLGPVEVIFLPTFRRVEKPLLRGSRRDVVGSYPAMFPAASPAARRGLHTYQGITFGLGDIEARLAELSEEIERQSNIGYRQSSARILQDMSRGREATLKSEGDHLPDIQTLDLFLGRIGKTDRSLRELLKNIRKLYETHEIGHPEYEHLRYFLYRINQVAEQTKSLEQQIERFVEVCNSYLQLSSDEKMLSFDPASLKVLVWNTWSQTTIQLDELSSGEKQIVSLMAKVYLYPGEKIVLIDEPELSLSMEWQRMVLPDVARAGGIKQLLAITHSPFVFENELDQFTTPLLVKRSGG